MSKLKTYSEFINEGMIDAIKNPIKWKKIKNNAKKFQKAKVAHALNDVDYAKKLAQSDSKKETDVLKKTNTVKNASLKDIQSNIGTRMDDLATTPGLKQVVKLAKTTSNLAANKIIIKAATGEQAKQLKIRQKELVGKVSAAKNALKDYETTEKPKKETTKEGTPSTEDKGSNKEAIEKAQGIIDTAKAKYNSIGAEDKAGKIDAEIAFKQAQQKKATLEDNKELIQGLGDDIGELMTKKKELGNAPDTDEDKIAQLEDKISTQDKIQTANSEKIDKLKGKLETAKANKNTGRSSQTEVDKLKELIQQATEDRTNAATEEKALKKKLKPLADKIPESAKPLGEGMYTASQLTDMLLDDIRRGDRKGTHAPDEKELKELAKKRLKMNRLMKADIQDTIDDWDSSLAAARKDKHREFLGKIPESVNESYVPLEESVSAKFKRLRLNL